MKRPNNLLCPKIPPRQPKIYSLRKCGSQRRAYLFQQALLYVFLLLFILTVLPACQSEANRNDPLIVTARLIDLLKDPDVDTRRTAALSLGKIAHPSSEKALVEALNDPDSQVREYSAWALGQLGDVVDNSTAQALVGALGDEEAPVKMAVAKALGRIGTRQSVVELLNEAILVGTTASRRYAVDGLTHLEGKSTYSTLLVALDDPDARVRQGALAGLGELGNPKAVPVLKKRLLEDTDMGVRAEAAYRLGKLGSRKDLAVLQRAADTDPDPFVHLWAIWAMENINPSLKDK